MRPRIYSGPEAAKLREDATLGPWFIHRSGVDGYTEIMSEECGQVLRFPEDHDGGGACVSECDAAMMAASYDLAVSVEYHAGRADLAEHRCTWAFADAEDRIKVVMDEGEAHANSLFEEGEVEIRELRTQLAAAHARIAELERLAAGPRSAESVDDGLARPFAPETLRGWDADGREVSR